MHLRRTRICPHRRLFRARPFDSDSNGTLGPSQIPASDSWLRKTFLRTLRLAPCQKSYDRKREPAIKIEAGSPRVAFFSLWCANKDNSFPREIHALNLPSRICPRATMVGSRLCIKLVTPPSPFFSGSPRKFHANPILIFYVIKQQLHSVSRLSFQPVVQRPICVHCF